MQKIIMEMSNLVEANEPDTIDYRFYFDEFDTRCVVPETYNNQEAVCVHTEGITSNTGLPKIHKISQITRFEVYGAVNKKLRKAMEGLNPQVYILYTGFNR
ncbi:MAG: hypothetical protein L0H53_05315 [Candidatus Nitrosocosmicus sp.]|nr:hypothetical protein [Candidatus Nitrosocosmicus sp.]MDN5867432.1 hypothetical protein [Candidatus Nitrosocosmicus sp.]